MSTKRRKRQIAVTPEMIEAGVKAFDDVFLESAPYERGKRPKVEKIFRAMAAASPSSVERSHRRA